MKKNSRCRMFILFIAKALFIGIFSHSAHAGLEDACWTDPLQIIFLSNGKLVTLDPPKQGAKGVISFDYTPSSFSAKCSNSYNYEWRGMFVEAELGPYLTPSPVNSGYYRLSDGVDATMGLYADNGRVTYPIKLEERVLVRDGPPWFKPGQGIIYDKFRPMVYLSLHFILTKDILGGAIYIPANIDMVTIYSIVSRRSGDPLPPKPDKPFLRIVIGPQGIIIPVPIVCDINNGTDINVEFDRIAVSAVSESVSNTANHKDVPLEVKCSSALNQEVNLRLVAGTPSFSDELIATNYPDLGIAVKHKGHLLKPMGTSAVRLINGMASEVITVFPVKKKGQPLSGGEFNASATLLISLP